MNIKGDEKSPTEGGASEGGILNSHKFKRASIAHHVLNYLFHSFITEMSFSICALKSRMSSDFSVM
jgi:hypothetical protein